jgi:hypothetical protein
MDDLGIDYSLLYPSAGLFVVSLGDPDIREEVVRATTASSSSSWRPTPIA